MKKQSTIIYRVFVIAAFAGYIWLSGSFLLQYPYVHSDEAWLSGLSRAMLEEGSPAATEPFFNLKERWPHGIKLLFHQLQILALRFTEYEIHTFRLLSLLAAVPALMLFYLAACRLFGGQREPALIAAALLGADAQFIYASHMARQEIFILLALCACLFVLLRNGRLRLRDAAALAVITGLAVGFHPNAFLLACCCGAALLAKLGFRQANIKHLALYIGLTGAIAGVFVLISLSMDSQFLHHYAAYAASEFGLNLSLAERLGEAPLFWRKLFSGVSGTYYLPQLRPQLFIFPALALLLFCYTLAMRREQPAETGHAATLLAAIAGLSLGIVLLGRYNQLSLVFLFPLGWLISVYALHLFGKALFRVCCCLLLAIIICCSWFSVKPWLSTDYSAYTAQLQQHIPPGAITLGNLNSEYAFAYGQLLDYRNLAYLEANNLDIAAYVRRYGVEYIVYSAELDYIDANRPYWNIIYGHIDIAGLRDYAARHCELVYEFSDPIYGPRIVDLVGHAEYGQVSIYRVTT